MKHTMRMSKAILACVCLVGLTQLVWSQNKSFRAAQEKGSPDTSTHELARSQLGPKTPV